MKTGTREFYEMQEQFEKSIDKLPIYIVSLEKEEKGAHKGRFYTDGEANNMFHAYMLGYGHGRINYM